MSARLSFGVEVEWKPDKQIVMTCHECGESMTIESYETAKLEEFLRIHTRRTEKDHE